MKDIDVILNKINKKINKLKEEKKKEKKEEYIQNLKKLKKKVEEALNEGNVYISLEGFFEKEFASKFFYVEDWGSSIFDRSYIAIINKKGLKKMYKKIIKYNLEE